MTFAWSSRDRLCPMRMVYDDIPHYAKYEIKKEHRPRLRRWPKLGWHVSTKLELCRMGSSFPPGRLGEWPVFRYGRRKRSLT